MPQKHDPARHSRDRGSGQQHELAGHASGLAQLVRLLRFGERKAARDVHQHLAGGHRIFQSTGFTPIGFTATRT